MTNAKRGFTLVELLVVIAIIGTLTALILPAVNSARNAARQTECSNNVRQIASAMQIFASSKGYMPPYAKSIKASSGPVLVTDFVYSILPMIEQNVLRDEIDSIVQKATSINADSDGYLVMYSDSAKGNISILACPSNPPIEGDFKPSYIANGGHRDPASTSEWVGSDRPNGALSLSLEESPWSNLSGNALSFKTTLDYISANDGTAQTIVASENVRFSSDPAAGWLPRVGIGNLSQYLQRIELPRTFWWHYDVDGPPQGDGEVFDNSQRLPFPGFLEEVTASGEAGAVQKSSPYSYHSGGFLVGYADGHVSFISSQIGYRVYAKLMTCNGRSSCSGRRSQPAGYYYQDRALSADDINP